MTISMKQSLALKQTLKMTPQLQQAIKLLQLSRLELENAIRQEIQENPVLDEIQELQEDEVERQRDGDNTESTEDPYSALDQDPQKQDEFEWGSYLDIEYKPNNTGIGSTDEIMNYENIISTSRTLHDHLMWQMKMFGFNEEEEYIASVLISYIDEDGYIKVPLEEIAKEEDVELEELNSILPFIHEFDPPGIGARNLKECLLVQAKLLEEDTNDLVYIINNHLNDLERKNYENIAKSKDIDIKDVIEMCSIIYSMEPKPGRAFISSDTQYVTPDVYVYKVGDEYVVSLNEDGLPKLRISNLYKNILKTSDSKDQTHSYIQDKLKSAIWIIKSIHQRQRTIYKVAESIVKYQIDFFEKGPTYIKPMILRDIANDIEMHESTVSRVTTNKFIHTPRGIYELKYFFNSGISRSDGDSLASEAVKLKIKELISNEDIKNPLSDQKIVNFLKKEGLQIARRTVAKYRDMLKILPSNKRKKNF